MISNLSNKSQSFNNKQQKTTFVFQRLVLVNDCIIQGKCRGFFLFFLAFDFCRFRVVIRFLSPPQRPMTSDFEGFTIPDLIHYIYFPILILEKEPVFPFLMLSAKQGNYWYHFYNVFGMTRSLTGD